MAGRKYDPMTEAAVEVVEMDRKKAEIAMAEREDRERLIAQCHEVIGRVQANNLMMKFGNVASLVDLQKIKEAKIYRDLPSIGTWDKFCEYIGLSRRKVDEDLLNLEILGNDFLATCRHFSIGYHDLRKLRKLTSNGQITINAEAVVIGDERIPLDPDHREDLQDAIESIIERHAALQNEMAAQEKANRRVSEENHKRVVKLQRELDELIGKGKNDGGEIEKQFIQKMDAARLQIQGFLDDFDPERHPLPDNATVRMRATYMHTLAWFKRWIIAAFDTANDLYGEPEMDDEWVPFHLRGQQAAAISEETAEDAEIIEG